MYYLRRQSRSHSRLSVTVEYSLGPLPTCGGLQNIEPQTIACGLGFGQGGGTTFAVQSVPRIWAHESKAN